MNNVVYNIYIFDAHWLLYVVTIVLLCLNFVKYNSRLNNFIDVKSFLNMVLKKPHLNPISEFCLITQFYSFSQVIQTKS